MLYTIPPSTKQYSFNYCGLKFQYETFCSYTDEAFLIVLPEAIHFACIVSFVKGLSIDQTLSDIGIVHQLVHLLQPGEPTNDLTEIRKDFETLLKLS